MAVLVIPARFASKRLPGKPLLRETGRPLIAHVLERALAARRIARAVVATDDPRIHAAVLAEGGEAMMTAASHTCGTERVAEVAAGIPEAEHFVNLQGDEPEIDPADIDLLVETIEESGAEMATLAAPLDPAHQGDPAVVKVVTAANGDALYFSRAAIPHARDASGPAAPLHHLGIYAFTRAALARFAAAEPTPLERTEKLEQLRALENGMRIRVAMVESAPPGIDTMEAYRAFVLRHGAGRESNRGG